MQQSIAAADLGKLYRERLAATLRELDALGKVVGAPVAITVGPDAAPGRGLIVSDALCAAALGGSTGAPQIAARTAAADAPHGRGCAGCASPGDPSLALALAWLVTAVARRGRSRPRARARRRDTADAATRSRGP